MINGTLPALFSWLDYSYPLSFFPSEHVSSHHLFSYLFIYLTMPHLSCGMQGLCCGMWTISCRTWDLVPWPGIEPRSPALGAQGFSCWSTRKSIFSSFKLQLYIQRHFHCQTGKCLLIILRKCLSVDCAELCHKCHTVYHNSAQSLSLTSLQGNAGEKTNM